MTHAARLLMALIAMACLLAATSALAEDRPASPDERRSQFLERFDTDGDGVLSEAERSAARDELRREHEAWLEKYDKNGDGRLSPSERKEAGLPPGPGVRRRLR